MSLDKLDVRDVFFDEVYEQCKFNPNLFVISADMDAFSLRKIAKDFPEQFLNAGVSEQNMINIAAGMALYGKRVICYSIASFATLRCFEQIKVNLCSHNLPVTIVGAGAGFSFGYDGPTHHGHQDLSSMRLLPEMSIVELSSNDLAQEAAKFINKIDGPCYIRLDKGEHADWSNKTSNFGKGFRFLRTIKKVNFITNGHMTNIVLQARDELAKMGIEIGVIDLFFVKPTPKNFVSEVLALSDHIISVEENCVSGGLGTILAEEIARGKFTIRLTGIGAPDKQFIEYGERSWFHRKYGLCKEGLIKQVKETLNGSPNPA